MEYFKILKWDSNGLDRQRVLQILSYKFIVLLKKIIHKTSLEKCSGCA